jgi:hypothetical protein
MPQRPLSKLPLSEPTLRACEFIGKRQCKSLKGFGSNSRQTDFFTSSEHSEGERGPEAQRGPEAGCPQYRYTAPEFEAALDA